VEHDLVPTPLDFSWLTVKLKSATGGSCDEQAPSTNRAVVVTRTARKARLPETLWLDDDQQRAWRHIIAMVMALPAALESELQRATGLTMFEYLVLANLSEADGTTLRMSELAHRANSSLSRLSHVVSRLARSGWVVKRPCSDDGRVSEVKLTKAGMKKVTDTAPLHVAKVRELVVEPLTRTELSRLGDAAAAIAERVAESSHAGGPAD
jgi:DNA-binding MarR family transcriptional regulator